jgi:aminoglycoside phosphotransferase family enzyme/predicted kinase
VGYTDISRKTRDAAPRLVWGVLTDLVEAMSQPVFYAHRPESVELVETHISWVFLAGELAFKVKKPVVFPFLDYGTPERRRVLCQEEVRLNRRLAPDLYRGVHGLARRDGDWGLADADDPSAEEWAVEMRRFDEGRTLAGLLAAGSLRKDDVAAVGRLVARFHAGASVVEHGGSRVEAARRATGDNFDEIAACPDAAPERALASGRRLVNAFLARRGEELEGRARAGLVRDCHGDLRAEHVVFEERVEVFDCIEFTPRLREIDVAADVAFLTMDLVHSEREDLATAFVAAYREAGGDPGDDPLLSFFAAYRAWVRVKVACLRAGELPPDDERRETTLAEAPRFAATARRFEWRARAPRLLVICGSSATGKTFLATRLERLSGWTRLSSDAVRKELLGLEPTGRAPSDAYTPEVSERTYAELGRRARAQLAAGGGVIVDATFRFRRDRQAFGTEDGLFVECRAPAALLADRAAAREGEPGRISDADLEQVERQQLEFEPLDELPGDRRSVLDTDRPAEELEFEVEALLDATGS